MTEDNNELKTRLERVKNELGNAYSDVNTLTTTNTTLKNKNRDLIKELQKSNDLLNKAKELINNRATGDGEAMEVLGDVETEITRLKNKIDELKTINADLVAQNEELQRQSANIYNSSLAIVGVFAGGAWIVTGISNFIETIRSRV